MPFIVKGRGFQQYDNKGNYNSYIPTGRTPPCLVTSFQQKNCPVGSVGCYGNPTVPTCPAGYTCVGFPNVPGVHVISTLEFCFEVIPLRKKQWYNKKLNTIKVTMKRMPNTLPNIPLREEHFLDVSGWDGALGHDSN